MVTLKYLKFSGVRSFSQSAEIYFNENVTAIQGKTGSGKTTVIEVLYFAMTGMFPASNSEREYACFFNPDDNGHSEVNLAVEKDGIPIGINWKYNPKNFKKSRQLSCRVKRGDGGWSSEYSVKEAKKVLLEALGFGDGVLKNLLLVAQDDTQWPFNEPAQIKNLMDRFLQMEAKNKELSVLKAEKEPLDKELKTLQGCSYNDLKSKAEEYDKVKTILVEDRIYLADCLSEYESCSGLSSKATAEMEELQNIKGLIEKVSDLRKELQQNGSNVPEDALLAEEEVVRLEAIKLEIESKLVETGKQLKNMQEEETRLLKSVQQNMEEKGRMMERLKNEEKITQSLSQFDEFEGPVKKKNLEDRIKQLEENGKLRESKRSLGKQIFVAKNDVTRLNKQMGFLQEEVKKEKTSEERWEFFHDYKKTCDKVYEDYIAKKQTFPIKGETSVKQYLIKKRLECDKTIEEIGEMKGTLSAKNEQLQDLENLDFETSKVFVLRESIKSFMSRTTWKLKQKEMSLKTLTQHLQEVENLVHQEIRLHQVQPIRDFVNAQETEETEPPNKIPRLVSTLPARLLENKEELLKTEERLNDLKNEISSLSKVDESPAAEQQEKDQILKMRLYLHQLNEYESNQSADGNTQSLMDTSDAETTQAKERLDSVRKEIQQQYKCQQDFQQEIYKLGSKVIQMRKYFEALGRLEEAFGTLSSFADAMEDARNPQMLKTKLENSKTKAKSLCDKQAMAREKLAIAKERERVALQRLGKLVDAPVALLEREADITSLKNKMKSITKTIKAKRKEVMDEHQKKLGEINDNLSRAWDKLYPRDDIGSITLVAEIKREEDARVVYEYGFVMQLPANKELKMRGRSSYGEKMLASFIIRDAFQKTFSEGIGFLGLDATESGLDSELSATIVAYLSLMSENCQIVFTTVDNSFAQHVVTRCDSVSHYEVSKSNANSEIARV